MISFKNFITEEFSALAALREPIEVVVVVASLASNFPFIEANADVLEATKLFGAIFGGEVEVLGMEVVVLAGVGSVFIVLAGGVRLFGSVLGATVLGAAVLGVVVVDLVDDFSRGFATVGVAFC